MDRYTEWRKISFSDINHFDLENFIFLTYSIPIDGNAQANFFKSMISNSNLYEKSQDFDISLNPIQLRMKKRISVSLTTSNNYYTYGRIGYIVSAPIENILYAGQAPFNDSNSDLREKNLKSPDDVLLGKVPFHEIVLEGSTYYGDVKPLAIFINLTDATNLERFQVEQTLEKIKKTTFGLYPIFDLTNPKKELKNNSKMSR